METVLVAYDDSDPARAALSWTIDYASGREVRVLMLYVMSWFEEWELEAFQVNTDVLRGNIERLLRSKWSEPLREAGIDYEAYLRIGRPAAEILRCADEEDVSLIVVGLATRGTLFDLLAQSGVERVLHRSQRPVVAVPAKWNPATRHGEG